MTLPWSQPTAVLAGAGPWDELDAVGASSPCVLEDGDGTARLWYSGHDGSTERILGARRDARGRWERTGVELDVGASGETDAYGVGSPCVVRTSNGAYVMAYAGSDGATTSVHLARSSSGHGWRPDGVCVAPGEAAAGATHPCLVLADRWWMFYAAYDGSRNGRRSRIMAATSTDGARWEPVGPVLEPEADELGVSEPWVVMAQREFHMFYVSDDDRQTDIELATSDDGLVWQRRGRTLAGPSPDGRGVRSPCVVRTGAALTMLYAGPASSAPAADERLWSVQAERSAL
ncbi:MAG: hypothetical protein S0880_20710 [Actinomycetota bacterium]|nr:hypothetical protein [Actinomycetota bacterium]